PLRAVPTAASQRRHARGGTLRFAHPTLALQGTSVASVALAELHDLRVGDAGELLIIGARRVVDTAADTDFLARRADDRPTFVEGQLRSADRVAHCQFARQVARAEVDGEVRRNGKGGGTYRSPIGAEAFEV